MLTAMAAAICFWPRYNCSATGMFSLYHRFQFPDLSPPTNSSAERVGSNDAEADALRRRVKLLERVLDEPFVMQAEMQHAY
jgi:hypothetical protein